MNQANLSIPKLTVAAVQSVTPSADDSAIIALWEEFHVVDAAYDAFCSPGLDLSGPGLNPALNAMISVHRERACLLLEAICHIRAKTLIGASIQIRALRIQDNFGFYDERHDRCRLLALASVENIITGELGHGSEARLRAQENVANPFFTDPIAFISDWHSRQVVYHRAALAD